MRDGLAGNVIDIERRQQDADGRKYQIGQVTLLNDETTCQEIGNQ